MNHNYPAGPDNIFRYFEYIAFDKKIAIKLSILYLYV